MSIPETYPMNWFLDICFTQRDKPSGIERSSPEVSAFVGVTIKGEKQGGGGMKRGAEVLGLEEDG